MNKRYSDSDMDQAIASDDGVMFEVTLTKTIGQVKYDPSGKMTPYVAAFTLIADCGCDGTFEFPDVNGDVITVVVTRVDMEKVPLYKRG